MTSIGSPDRPGRHTQRSRPGSFFGAAFRPQTYLNVLYLLLSFPLGLAYFIYLVVGISVGAGLAIIYVGVVILIAMLYSWGWVAEFDRIVTNALLGTSIPRQRLLKRPERWWTLGGLKARLAHQSTWRGLVYLLLRFPQGVATFVIVVATITTAGSFLAVPILVAIDGTWARDVSPRFGDQWHVDTAWEAGLLFAAGVVLMLLVLPLLNGVAWLSGQMATFILSAPQPAATRPIAPTAPATTQAAVTSDAPGGEAVANLLLSTPSHDPVATVEEPNAPPEEQPAAIEDELRPISVDVVMRRVRSGGRTIELTPKEFDLLALLAQHPGRPFSRDELLDRVWASNYEVTDRTIDTHVLRLRKKLDPHGDAIETVWGVGYRFRTTGEPADG